MGSTIEKIHSLRDGGFMIQYEHGDICNEETGARYKAQISFTCDMGNGDPTY